MKHGAVEKLLLEAMKHRGNRKLLERLWGLRGVAKRTDEVLGEPFLRYLDKLRALMQEEGIL